MTPPELKQLRACFPHGWAGSFAWYRYVFGVLLERQLTDAETQQALEALQIDGRQRLRAPRMG